MANFFRRLLCQIFYSSSIENIDFVDILPVPGYLPFELNSWSRYIWVNIFQFLVAINMVTAHVSMLITFVIHAKLLSEQYEILSIFIEETFKFDENFDEIELNKGNIYERQKFIDRRVKVFTEQHIALLKYSNLFQEMYSLFLLLFAVSSGAMVCTVAYIITDPKSTTMMLIIGIVCIFLTEVIIIGTYCWFGQLITDKSLAISEVIYCIPWYNQSLSVQKSILNILTLANQKRIIKGGGVQEFSMKGLNEVCGFCCKFLCLYFG
ncbi:hypothetical protein O3M35_001390 [Rhynocoris fuscipes]|uniref:Uncharacterized protein n=1 Tax=Rhynocoris fuscipes TaxID=488301 RepID=A0AAW1CUW2_9HEMI